MRKTLEALFYGELQAVDMRMKQSGRIARAVTEATELEEWISAKLPEGQKKQLEQLLTAKGDQLDATVLDYYIMGLRTGARLILELLDHDDGELEPVKNGLKERARRVLRRSALCPFYSANHSCGAGGKHNPRFVCRFRDSVPDLIKFHESL